MISFMNGFNEYLEDTLLSSTPDIHIYNDIKTDYTHSILDAVYDTTKGINIVHHPKPKNITPNVHNPKQIISDIKTFDNILAVSPQLSSQVFYNNGPVQVNGTLSGVNIMEEAKLTNLADKMKTGAIENLLKVDNGILLGQGLANKLNANVGDSGLAGIAAGHIYELPRGGYFSVWNRVAG
jgi:lipoprotein-releasing system permease protein